LTDPKNNLQPDWRLADLDPTRPIHLAGIAGSAMSGLAVLLRQRGFPVRGTDPAAATVADRLAANAVETFVEQDGSHILPGTQLVIATAALPADHPELEAASRLGIPTVKYAAALGALMRSADGIAIAGTHGKTTTTALLVSALRGAGVRPGFLIGGDVPQLGGNADGGSASLFVAEACEYDRSFLELAPTSAVITNIDTDHLDVYGDLAGVRAAFAEFAHRLPADGLLVHPADDPNALAILDGLPCRTCSFSSKGGADFAARNIRRETHRSRFELHVAGHDPVEVSLLIPGAHNIDNALAALALGHDRGLPLDRLAAGIAEFRGVRRRFELRGVSAGVTVIDDYAHHPTEIRALIRAARDRYGDARLVIVFQPHQTSRTELLFEEFSMAFDGADLVCITDIYAAREAGVAAPPEASPERLAAAIVERGTAAEHLPTFAHVTERLGSDLRAGDVCLTVGAGDVDLLAEPWYARRDRR